MAIIRKTLLAATLIGAGVASTTGSAFASEHHHASDDRQEGLANVDNVQTIVPINLCNNDVPVNIAGIQIPLQDIVADIPILSGADHHSGHSAGDSKSCDNGVKAHN